MSNKKRHLKDYFLIKEICKSLNITDTSDMGYDEVFSVIIKEIKNGIEKMHFNKVDKMINALDQDNLLNWEQELLNALHLRKLVSHNG